MNLVNLPVRRNIAVFCESRPVSDPRADDHAVVHIGTLALVARSSPFALIFIRRAIRP